jgi:hypothetical protein
MKLCQLFKFVLKSLEYVKDVLLDGGSSVNIISVSLKKLGLRKLKLAPFVVKMTN